MKNKTIYIISIIVIIFVSVLYIKFIFQKTNSDKLLFVSGSEINFNKNINLTNLANINNYKEFSNFEPPHGDGEREISFTTTNHNLNKILQERPFNLSWVQGSIEGFENDEIINEFKNGNLIRNSENIFSVKKVLDDDSSYYLFVLDRENKTILIIENKF